MELMDVYWNGLKIFKGQSQTVVIDGDSSKPSTILSGVPQVTVLAPILFLIFINDIVQDLHCTVRLYADDILIYHTIHTLEDCILLQQYLSSLQVWATKWQMEFNSSKCVHLTISNKHHPIKYNYYISNHLLQKVSGAKYLGVTLTNISPGKTTFIISVLRPMLLKLL